MSKKHQRLIILGSGPAGYTAAIYAARANLEPAVITGLMQGGQLTQTTAIDNWPGDPNGVSGQELMDRMRQHAERFGTEVIIDHIHSADLINKPFSLKGDKGEYTCDALIIATGASAKYLGLSSEQKYLGKGVSACATCDGFFYRNKKVAVVGGSNTAFGEALYLAGLAKEVTIIHRRDEFRAEKVLIDEIKNKKNIKIKTPYVVEEIVGDDFGVTGVMIKNLLTKQSDILIVAGVFIAIGHTPNTTIFENQLAMDEDGYIQINLDKNGHTTATNLAGVFVAGDAADRIYKQAITAAASGCMAAKDAARYLETLSIVK